MIKKLKNLEPEVRNWIKKNRLEALLITSVLLLGAFFRLYKIDDYMTFLGDEGRDVIVVRRLLVNFDPILVGPGTSIGDMYLGPLYYYMMAPALLLANFSPVGPAVMIALLGIATIFFVWKIAREWFGKLAGFIAAFLYAISPAVIIYSKSSWNPNIMPFFALLCIYSIWQFWQKGKIKWLIVCGVAFAFALQSHYLGLLLAPVIGFFFLLSVFSIRKDSKKLKMYALSSFLGLVLFATLMSPLVVFDWRHGWRNAGAISKFFSERQTTVSARPWTAIPKLPEIVTEAVGRLVTGANFTLAKWLAIASLAILVWLFVFYRKRLKEKQVAAYLLLLIWMGVAFVGLGVYKQEVYDHYYGFFFPAPFLFIGGLSSHLFHYKKVLGGFLILVFLVIIVSVNLAKNPLKYPPNRQLQRTIEVAEKITEESESRDFNLAVIAERNYEGAYQYFLEAWGAKFVKIDPQKADVTIAEQLFVVCELPPEKCDPINNPKAEIANFGWSKIETEWGVSGVILYKLVHAL